MAIVRETIKFIVFIFLLIGISSAQKIGVDLSHGQDSSSITQLRDIVEKLGFELVEVRDFNVKDLDELQGLIIDPGDEISDEELRVLENWFKKGGKMLWISGKYDKEISKIYFANKILERVESKLRLEQLTLIKYTTYSEPLYVIADVVNNKSNISSGVSKVLFYSPTIVCGYDYLFGFIPVKTYVSLEDSSVADVEWVIKSGFGSIAILLNNSSTPFVHEPYICPLRQLPTKAVCVCGREPWEFEEEAMKRKSGYVVMATEFFAGPKLDNKIIVTGSLVYGENSIVTKSYTNPARKINLDGVELTKNALAWGMKIEKGSKKANFLNYYLLALISIFTVLVILKRLRS